MAKRINDEQRQAILTMLAEGHDRHTIASQVGVTPAQVSAIGAHVTMGTYRLDELSPEAPNTTNELNPATENLLARMRHLERSASNASTSQFQPILLGEDGENSEQVFWNPDPKCGAANPHVLVLGESGFGKTYSVCCLLTELAQQGITSIVFDYAQGFTPRSAPKEFLDFASPVEIHAGRDGININPLQPFPFDLHGPVNVAQRVADTFKRVYSGIGIQQHAVLRQAVIDLMGDRGITADDTDSWESPLPPFADLRSKLDSYANQTDNPNRRHAAAVSSHISTVFVFNTFRANGQALEWRDMLNSRGRVYIVQLKGLEHSLEKAVTEFLLWNFIGFVESLGPGPLRCFVVLDEAHKLSFDKSSPSEKLLREGRKFGLGLILASQQPEDFSSVAFGNSATKLIFQIGDDCSSVSRQLHRKVRNTHSFADIYEIVTKLPRGWAYVVTDNVGRVTKIESIEERAKRWTQ